jgi:primosomal protein N''
MLQFLVNEREMILKAVMDGEEIDPVYQVSDLYAEEAKRKKLEDKISIFQKQWEHAISQTVVEIEKTTNDTELKEYRARLAILGAELNEKNDMIASIEKEKAAFEELSSKAMTMGMSISD